MKKKSNESTNTILDFCKNYTFIIIIVSVIIAYISFLFFIVTDNGNCTLKEEKDGIKIYECKLENGDSYEGEVKNGKQHGEGTYIWTNKDKYIGQWKNGKRHGKGIYIFNNGNVYIGQWKDGEKTEGKEGTHIQASDGTIKNDIKMIIEDGNFYEGEYQNNKFNGRGIYKFKNGDIYDGYFKDGMRHGHGIYTWGNNKAKYDGEWKNGKRHGEGTMTYYGYIWNSKEYGIWLDDQLIKKL